MYRGSEKTLVKWKAKRERICGYRNVGVEIVGPS